MSRCRNPLVLALLATIMTTYVVQGSQYSTNMFLNGQYQNVPKESHFSVNPSSNIFLNHAIISREASPFQGPTYLPPKENLKCGAGQQCVRLNQCQNGYFSQQLPKIQNCEPESNICCIYRPAPTTTTTTSRPFSTCGPESDCVLPQDCRNGEIASDDYVKKQGSNRCYAPEICCRMPSTTLTEDGYIFNLPEKTFPLPTNPTVPAQRPTQPSYRPQPTSPPQPARPTNEYLPPQSTRPQPSYQPQSTQTAYRPQPTQSRPQPTPPAYHPQPQPQSTQPAYRPQPQPQSTQPAYRPQPQPQSTQPAYRPQPQPQSTQPAYRPQPQPQSTQPAYRPQPQPQSTQSTYRQPQPQPQSTQIAYRPQPQPQSTQPAYRPQPTQPTRRPTNEYLPPVSQNEIPHRDRPVSQPPRYEPDRESQPSNEKPVYRGEDLLSPQIFPSPKYPSQEVPKHFSKCASALVCTAENYCNTIGVITDTPVELTPMQAAFRVPLTDCLLPDSGAPGKCCRDSNYVDPWPVNLAGVCASRNKNTKPAGIKDLDANFAEIPWQAMVLKDSTKSLLCGGAIIGDEFVLTTGTCVQGVSVNDVRVKAGEWELGSTNEPLPFQLVAAKTIDTHPEFNPSTGANNMAIIRLQNRLEFATHIQPICISDEDPSPSEKCVTTGWGKQALQIHEEGAVMHVTNTSPLARSDCGADGTSVCSATRFDACEFDAGSALACGTGSSVRLKGVFSAENGCGEGQSVRFSKPDVKWINTAFADRNRPLLLKRV